MSELDPYQVLGIDASATDEQVREAYRRLARLVHPDTAPAWEEEEACNRWMRMLNEAYAVLGDPLKRAQYDRTRQSRAPSRGGAAAYYETPQAVRARARRQSRPVPQGWPEVVFEDTKTAQFAFGGFLAAIALYAGVISWTTQPLWFVLPVMVLGAAIAAVHAIAVGTSLRGYIVLDKVSLIE